MSSSTTPYSALPQEQSMAPIHQSLATPSSRRPSITRKSLVSPNYHSRKTVLVSEQDVDRTPADDSTWGSWRTSSPERSEKHDYDSSRVWLVELASLTLAIIAFIAIIVTLLMHQDRPLPKWPSLISINTLVAIFTNIMQAAMLLPVAEGISQLKWLWFRNNARPLIDLKRFDSASRGPWGCVSLIVRHTSCLAALGACLTIIAMAIDPFAQQVIQYDYCSTKASDVTASIPRTNNYTAGSRAANGGVGLPSGAMNAAFFGQGLYDPPASAAANIHTSCPTGNCTIPATSNYVSYMSLGMCSSCADISDTITNVTTNATDSEGRVLNSYVNYMLPSNLTISPLGHGLVAATLVVTPPQIPISMMVSQSMITFDMLWEDTSGCKNISTTSGCQVWASRCSLTPCVKSYGANIANGVLHERELAEVPLQTLPAPGGLAYFGIITNSTVVDGQVRECQPTKEPTERNTLRMAEGVTWISEEYLKNVSSAPYYPPECAFTLGVGSTDGLATILIGAYANQNITQFGVDYVGSPWMLELFNEGTATPNTLGKAISGLSNAITAALRNGGDKENSAPASGTVMVSQTCIRVRWAWLVLPAALLLLASLFLACTILQTTTDSIGTAWKSSPLALLFHGFGSVTCQGGSGVARASEMEATARKMKVQLTWAKRDGWRFSEVSSEQLITDCDQAPPKWVEGTVQPDAPMYFAPPPRQGV